MINLEPLFLPGFVSPPINRKITNSSQPILVAIGELGIDAAIRELSL
ncbi:hypothetical protein [Candidatus Burkholderia verschuerenii]|nr:hypothetical protein [Candidatus Burkholderia verschuerenii]